MILTKLKLNRNNKPQTKQIIVMVCEDCGKEYSSSLIYQIKGIKKYGRDLCIGCKQRQQIKNGTRGKQYINAGIAAKKLMSGKTHIELYGIDKALEMKKINSQKNSGKNNRNYRGMWHGINPSIKNKGKTYDEIHGKQKADKIKNKLSKKSSGENNPMYGKPSPNGSGNGWCGWYNNWHFRSLLELSFMLNVIERFNFKWKSAECKKYKIKYIDFEGNERNYFPDFILNDKYLVEIKPKSLYNTTINKNKKIAAIEFCNKNNLKYKLMTPKKLLLKDIDDLIQSGKIKFIDRYQIKYEQWKNNN